MSLQMGPFRGPFQIGASVAVALRGVKSGHRQKFDTETAMWPGNDDPSGRPARAGCPFLDTDSVIKIQMRQCSKGLEEPIS